MVFGLYSNFVEIRGKEQKCSMIGTVHRWITPIERPGCMGYVPQTMYRHELRQKAKCHNERTRGNETPPEEPGAGTASGRTGKDCTKMILKHDIWAGVLYPARIILGALKDGLAEEFLPEIAPKRYTKMPVCPLPVKTLKLWKMGGC